MRARRNMTYLPHLHSDEETEHYITNLVKNEKMFVAEVDNIPAGFIQFDDTWIHHLYIDPEFQNKGVGKQLLDAVKKDSSELFLWVFEHNTGAIEFYEREGFTLLGKRDTHQSDNEEGLPDRKYKWTNSLLQ